MSLNFQKLFFKVEEQKKRNDISWYPLFSSILFFGLFVLYFLLVDAFAIKLLVCQVHYKLFLCRIERVTYFLLDKNKL